MPRMSQSKQNAISLVVELMDVIEQIRSADRRTTKELVKLLRQGCEYTVMGGNPDWEEHINVHHGLDTGEALLLLSNELVPYDGHYTLDDLTREFSK